MSERLTLPRADPTPLYPRAVAAYETVLALAGWGALIACTLVAGTHLEVAPALYFVFLAVGLKLEGFRVAPLVTHSLAGVAVLAALLALGSPGGVWVAAPAGFVFLALRLRPGRCQLRLALFNGGQQALVLLLAARIYTLLGGRWAPANLQWSDLPPLLGLCLTWFLGDHLGWSLRAALAGGRAGVARFLRSIRRYSLAVELLPLPLSAVVAIAYRALDPLSFSLLTLFPLAAGELLRRLNLTLERTRERVAHLSTLNALGEALLASKLDVQALCRLLQTHTEAALEPQHFWLGLLDSRREGVETALATGEAPAPTAELVAWMKEHRTPVLVRDAKRNPLPFPGAGHPGFRSALWVPLQAEGELIGLLTVGRDQPDAYNEDDLRTLITFANQAAMAIQNARSYQAEQRRARQVATVGKVSRQVVALLGMEELFARVVTLIRDAFAYYHVQIFTVDPATREIRFRASTSAQINERGFAVAPGQGLIGWVGQTGEAVAINDVSKEPRYRLMEGLEDCRSEAVVPLKVEERLVGILDVQSDRPDAFASDDLFVLQTLADQVAIAIEDNRLYQAEKGRRQLADTLREMATALNSILELPAVLDLVLTQLQRVIPYDSAAILGWREDHYCVMAGRGPRYTDLEQCLGPEHDERLQRLTAETAPFVYSDVGRGLTSLAAPLRVKDRLIGALIIEGDAATAHYGTGEMRLAAAFASQAAVAIENARLYGAEARRARQLATIAEVGQQVASILDLDELFIQVVRRVQEAFGYYHVAIYTVDGETGRVEFRASTAPPGRQVALRIEPGRGIISWVAAHGEPLLSNDVTQEPRYEPEETLPDTRSELAVPLRVEGRTVGVLDIQSDRPAAFTLEDLATTQTLADQVAIATENARLYAAQQEQAWVSTAMLQVAELSGRTKNLDEILSGVVRLTAMLTGVDRCCVFLWDAARRRYTPSHAYGLSEPLRARFQALDLPEGSFPLLDRVRESGAPLAAEDDAVDELAPAALAEAFGIRSILALPLRSQDSVRGIMVVDNAGQPHHFARHRIELLSGLTNQAGIAIENVQLYRESLERERIAQELQVARRIQATFLPERCPQIPGWSIAATSLPAREVSGDFYDFFPLSAHTQRLGLVIADVSDKGVPAALFMVLSRSIMRAVATEGHSPAETLRRVNELLRTDTRSGMFVTLFYGILDTQTGELALASAGHNPAYLRRRNGAVERLSCRGIALGVIAQPAFEERHTQIEPGDVLVLYTDGVTEAFDPDQREFGEEGLQATLRSAPATDAAGMLEAIATAVRGFMRGARPADDLTMVVVAREG